MMKEKEMEERIGGIEGIEAERTGQDRRNIQDIQEKRGYETDETREHEIEAAQDETKAPTKYYIHPPYVLFACLFVFAHYHKQIQTTQ